MEVYVFCRRKRSWDDSIGAIAAVTNCMLTEPLKVDAALVSELRYSSTVSRLAQLLILEQ